MFDQHPIWLNAVLGELQLSAVRIQFDGKLITNNSGIMLRSNLEAEYEY